MASNQSLWPRHWLMTDERMGGLLWQAVDRLPAGDGAIVLRHYSLTADERLDLGRLLAQRAAERGLLLAVAGSETLADALDAALVHNPAAPAQRSFSTSVHNAGEAIAAREEGAALIFVSPVYPTRSHPGARSLGAADAARLVQAAGCPAIALGGMNERRFATLDARYPGLFAGYAGIDCWLRD